MVSAEQIFGWLAEVSDPEIPVISIVDLGVVRQVAWAGEACEITITPTYSGCPAMRVIADAVRDKLHAHGVANVRIVSQLSPAWTTDRISETGRAALKEYGIAPPAERAIDISGLHGIKRGARVAPRISCPLCGSSHTQLVSQFGSTPCKALYKCLDCREPFDYFKCH
jgi:ring-1,2-phenylacetyl-CoA epoxidase subunit PaaD